MSMTFAVFPVIERTCADFFSRMGTSTLSLAGQTISRFLSSIMPTATMRAFALPCFPGFDVDTSVTLHGAPSIRM